eukprot:Lankesteria_metandrocarpae@DN10383_c0_g1_i1.p1
MSVSAPHTPNSLRSSHSASVSSRYLGHVDSTGGDVKNPLLPTDRKGDVKERRTANVLFIWLGISTLVLQTIVFVTMEDVQNQFFPSHRYAFLAHNVFAFSFFMGTAVFACFPPRLLFSLRLLSFLNVLAVFFAVGLPAVVMTGGDTEWAFITSLVLVGCITTMSVLVVPIVFTSATAVPGECAMYAAIGQGLGVVASAIIAVIIVQFLQPAEFMFACAALAIALHAVAVVSLQKLRSYGWVVRRLQRLTESLAAGGRSDSDVRRKSRSQSRSKRLGRNFSLMKKVAVQLLCAFLSTFLSFALFPAFSVRLGHNVSRGFGVAMVAIFHTSDQVGRHVPEFGLSVPPLVLCLIVLLRLGYLPLYVAMFGAASTKFLSTVLCKSLVQATLGLTHGWAVRSSFRYVPSGFTKYEVERVQFYLSLANALGIPCGALLMTGMVHLGYFPLL